MDIKEPWAFIQPILVSVINLDRAIGGTNGLSIDELRLQIPNALKMQSRIITHKDLLARIYTMPSNYGRVHKASVIDNPYTNLTKDLYIVCKDQEGYYVPAQDVIKVNLSYQTKEMTPFFESKNEEFLKFQVKEL